MTHPSDIRALGEALAADAQIAVIAADGEGNIVFWNAGAEALFGHSAETVAGHRVDLIVPHDLREMHWAGFNRTIGSSWRGHDSWGDIDPLHKSGQLVPLQVLLTPLCGAGDKVEGVFAMFRRREAAA